MSQSKISIVIPCYNESENIDSTYKALSDLMQSSGYQFELIFVDNGGLDDQLEKMKHWNHLDPDHVKIVSLSRNFGYQMSILSGIHHATGDAVVVIEADLQDPPELILQFIQKWEEGYHVVYGIRAKRQGVFFLRIFYKLFYLILESTSDISLVKGAGDFGLMDKKVVELLKKIPERVRFNRGLRSWIGFSQTGIPYTRLKREKGATKFRFLDNVALAMDGILSFSTRLLTLCMIFGVVVGIISFGLIIYILWWKLILGNDVPGYAAIMTSIAFFSGILIFLVGLIGAYVERIFIEVKQRPQFIVKELL